MQSAALEKPYSAGSKLACTFCQVTCLSVGSFCQYKNLALQNHAS